MNDSKLDSVKLDEAHKALRDCLIENINNIMYAITCK